jgi:hypothetical protein
LSKHAQELVDLNFVALVGVEGVVPLPDILKCQNLLSELFYESFDSFDIFFDGLRLLVGLG